MARLFTGIFPPDDVTAEIAPLREHAGDLDFRWIPPDKLHITLVFIGHVSDDDVDAVKKALSAARFESFQLRMNEVGAFPTARRASVLWVGIEPEEPVKRLHDMVKAELDPAQTHENSASRPYHPHVTVARARGKSRIDARPWVDRYRGFSGQLFSVRTFALVRSRTKPEGAEYTIIGRFGPGQPGGPM